MIDGGKEGSAIIGEIHTCLVHHSTAISPSVTEKVLGFVAGEQIRRSIRPIAFSRSPDVISGVDCSLPTASGAKVRGVGTVATRAAITGGRMLQASTYVTVLPAGSGRRRPWSYYLSQPATVELVGRGDATDIVRGFLDGEAVAGRLDLGAVSARAINRVQGHGNLDHRAAFRGPRGQVRWALTGSPTEGLELAIRGDEVRRFRLPRLAATVGAHIELCEDIARHDWLLTALVAVVERSLDTRREADVLNGLRTAIDNLLHLWMPAARLDPALTSAWTTIEQHPGMSRQWRVNVDRVRDQVALQTLERLRHR